MSTDKIKRRTFIKQSAIAAAGLTFFPSMLKSGSGNRPLVKRMLGKTGREITTIGLGGQASLQWTPGDVDPVAIIIKAYRSGINYFDTSNLYGPSQSNYAKAFSTLGLVPKRPGYDEKLRRSIFLTTKTHIRLAKGDLSAPGIASWTNGEKGSYAIDDVKRSLTLMFGDGKGYYPEGAYLDMVLLHSISSQQDVDAVLIGLDNPDPKDDTIGAVSALLDYRDGTNRTGLNPKEEKLIRHIGFSGHWNAGLMMQLIQRDKFNAFDGMLVAINANDKQNFNMQNNVIPVAQSKNIGVIGMKTFADGAMYTKPATWSKNTSHVVRQVGSADTPHEKLIQYTLTTPGVDTLIIGIGQISGNDAICQLTSNIKAAQIDPDGLSKDQRRNIEVLAANVKNGKTNYFQEPKGGLTAARNLAISKEANNKIRLNWDSAYAGDEPIEKYDIIKNERTIGTIAHKPQTTTDPFSYIDVIDASVKSEYKIVTIDKTGKRAESNAVAT